MAYRLPDSMAIASMVTLIAAICGAAGSAELTKRGKNAAPPRPGALSLQVK
jgi:hypothetical protein